jgi:hypothetical protein
MWELMSIKHPTSSMGIIYIPKRHRQLNTSNYFDVMKKIKPLPTWQLDFIDKWKPKT